MQVCGFLLRRLPSEQIDGLPARSMSRVELLYATVCLGFFLALFARLELFAYPFMLNKLLHVAMPVSAILSACRQKTAV
jgi:hypothetical protein